jgi:hypothetical protein
MGKARSSGNPAKKKGTMRNLKSKRETLSDKDARKVKGGLKYLKQY